MRTSRHYPHAGILRHHFTHYEGLYFDDFCCDSVWLRDTATISIPPLTQSLHLLIRGEIRHHSAVQGMDSGYPSLVCHVDQQPHVSMDFTSPGPFSLRIAIPSVAGSIGSALHLSLGGVGLTNALAWMGRVTGWSFGQRFRAQNKNRQLRLTTIETDEGEIIFDFSNRNAPYSSAFGRRHTKIALNVVGFLLAELGVGESARCMVRAADAAGLDTALVPLKLHCKNRLGDNTYNHRLQDANPHKFNIVHLDPPASRDIDHHHGKQFLTDKYNIAYWAWELPEFPDAWVPACNYFDEIWCPSDFARDAIAMKVALPVITMPHAIAFTRPTGDMRARFGLPKDKFIFLVLYDLNSYSERKNPGAVISAFQKSGLAGRGAVLVIKVHNVLGNETDLAALQAAVADLPGTIIISETLARDEVYLLEAACDCYVSLHRSEGFGLAVAECMYLGKPVISTDWSATAEFVNPTNGCPVNYQLNKLERNYGPYGKGQIWAEADVNHAAHWMKALTADPAMVGRLGAAARATIESRFSPETIGTRYRRRLENIIAW